MNTGDALLRACLDAPDDDLPRLVYADWLQENGAPERAEFIRLQLLISRHRRTGHIPADAVAREAELLSAHEAEWNPLPPVLRDTGCFYRGLLHRATVTTDEEAAALAHYHEITAVWVSENCTDAALDHLARLPFLAELSLNAITLTGDGVRALAQHPRLRRIYLSDTTIANPWLHYLRDTPKLVRILSLPARRGGAMPEEWDAWEQARAERFRSSSVEDQQRAARAFLFRETEYSQRENVGEPYLTPFATVDADIELLAALPALEKLDLTLLTAITSRGLWHLANFADLRVLRLGGNAIDNLDGIAQMSQFHDLSLNGMESPHNGSHERSLTDAGTAALATLTGLEALDLSSNPIRDVTLARLTGLTNLRKIELSFTRISDAGLRYLYGLKKLDHIDLKYTFTTAEAVNELRTRFPRANVLWGWSNTNTDPSLRTSNKRT